MGPERVRQIPFSPQAGRRCRQADEGHRTAVGLTEDPQQILCTRPSKDQALPKRKGRDMPGLPSQSFSKLLSSAAS
ncbi:hypothetical protein E0J21_30270 [Rhizobium laguerreae]|nr:hypothetical protein E0J21_30270 [Rhizobium laguerreae]